VENFIRLSMLYFLICYQKSLKLFSRALSYFVSIEWRIQVLGACVSGRDCGKG
jgi:hypothetical protein